MHPLRTRRTHTHTHMHTLTYTNRKKAWKQHAGCGLMFPLFMMANKVQRQKENHLTEKGECDNVYSEALYFWHPRARRCWSALWRRGQNNNQGLFLRNTEESWHKMFSLIENKLVFIINLTWSYIPRGIGGLWFVAMRERRPLSSLRSLFCPTVRMLFLRLYLWRGILSWSRLLLFISHHQARCGVIVKPVAQQRLHRPGLVQTKLKYLSSAASK